jgi:putative transposase
MFKFTNKFHFYQHTRGAKFQSVYHLVFQTKYRIRLFGPILSKKLLDQYKKINSENYFGIKVLGISIQPEHIHAIVSIPPSISVAKAVQKLKGNPSYYLMKEYPWIKEKTNGKNLWSPGYFIRSVGDVDIDTIAGYVNKQKKRHADSAHLPIKGE